MRGGEPFFSVVIPYFNRPHLCVRAIRSCLAQSFEDFEVIVIDDGSTERVTTSLSSLDDDRIRIIGQDNLGAAAARNKGFDVARGRFVALLDADDTFLPHKLAACHDYLLAHDSDFLFSYAHVDRGVGLLWQKPDRPPHPGEHITEYYFSAYQRTSTSTFVIRREVARAVRFDESLPVGQDIDFKIRLAGDGYQVEMIHEALAVYDDRPGAERVSRSGNGAMLETWLNAMRARYFTEKGYHAYRATMLTKYTGRTKPFGAFFDLVNGLARGGVAPKLTLRRALRAYFPTFYDRLVALALRQRGTPPDAETAKLLGDAATRADTSSRGGECRV